MSSPVVIPLTPLPFGALLKHLRKRVGMTQRDLAAALNYSDSFISSLEKEQRQPDLNAVIHAFIPALGLQDDPKTAAWLIERAAAARGELPPASITLALQRTTHLALQEEREEQTSALPAAPSALIGRADEVTQICHRLMGHSGRLLTLVGPPGIGKTTLALAVLTRLQHYYPNGVVFVALAAVNESALMATAIATAVGCSDAGLRSPKAKLIEFLRRKTLLLALDNLEQIQDAVPLIADLVAECSGLCVLATSRERLHLRAEQRFKVPPLALGAAVELFIQRAQAVDVNFRLTVQNKPTIEAICQRLDCLPLALELCVAQVDLLSPAQLLTQLQDHRLDLLVEGAHDLPPRQRTLRNAIEHSVRLLDEQERTLFRSLGVFVGGFDLSAATAVSDWPQAAQARPVLSTLHALINKNLVRSETPPGAEPRFSLLETIREFALDALAQLHGNALEQARQHHAEYFARFLKQENDEAVRVIDLEQHNARAALRWLLDHRHPLTGALALWLMVHLQGRGMQTECRRWLAELLSAGLELAPFIHQALLSNASINAWQQHDFEEGLRYGHEALDITRAMGLQTHISEKLSMLSRIYIEMGDGAQTKVMALEALRISRSIQDPVTIVAALVELGEANLIQGDVGLADACFKEAYALCHAPDFRQDLYSSLACKGMGELALCHCDHDSALRFLCEGLKYSKITLVHLWILNPLAGVIGTVPDCSMADVCRAAKIWGAAAALNEKMGTVPAPGDRRRTDALIAEARTRIAPDMFAAAWAEGRKLSLDEAVALGFSVRQ